jgi:hypothetical protein
MRKCLVSIVGIGMLLSAAGLLTTITPKVRAQMPVAQNAMLAAGVASTAVNMCLRMETPAKARHAYHEEPPTGPLPATLDPAQFAENKTAFVVYSIAAKIPELLYQEPCFCSCDKREGHQSLLDCYTGWHGYGCITCQTEVIFIYEQSKLGKSAAQIRKALENDDLWKVELNKYVEAHYAEYKHSAS